MPSPPSPRHHPTPTILLLASLSAAAAETATFPIDITKTRLQLHHHPPSPSSALRVATGIIRTEGFRGLYRGLIPAFARHLFYTPSRIVGYEGLRGVVGDVGVWEKAGIGGFSGVVAQVVASPADLVKVRLQADGHFVSQGLRRRYSGPIDVLNKTVRAEGLRGLWRGLLPNVQRAFLVNMGELACYDQAKR
ncbi:hypothetical protein Drorol1_Dr00018794 [Drosera rotundifolia]